MTRGHVTDVGGLIEHWRRAAAQARSVVDLGDLDALAEHIAKHVRDTAIGDGHARSQQLRAAGEALLISTNVVMSASTILGVGVLAQAIAGLQLVDEAFAIALAPEDSS